jgi:dihydroorotate dehydrogenase (NAD+) catalytic subunit
MIDITRPGKNVLTLETPVMCAAGVMGYGDSYSKLIHLDKLGAVVTHPLSHHEWYPAHGTRVVPLDAGVLIHSGYPNPGFSRGVREYRGLWGKMPIPVIVHLIATTPEEIRSCMRTADNVDSIAAIELGLQDDLPWDQAEDLVDAAVRNTEKPVIVRLPLYDAFAIAKACTGAGAGALVVSAPPRGVARDPRSGRLVKGRVYSPTVKPMSLRVVGALANRIQDVPIIGAGGIHTPQDARDYLEAGAVAVQVDSVVWIKPSMIERIARDLSGNLVTRATDALPDEWHPDMGDTIAGQRSVPLAPDDAETN